MHNSDDDGDDGDGTADSDANHKDSRCVVVVVLWSFTALRFEERE